MLHITNGDSAVQVMRRASLTGSILPWRDALHEGPVPAGMTLPDLSDLRARFIAAQGWAPFETVQDDFRARDKTLAEFQKHEEVVLWFEHDLYDQLQLLQVLDWFSRQPLGSTRLTLINIDEYFGKMRAERIEMLYPRRMPVTTEQLQLAHRAWTAFCALSPLDWQALISEDALALPYLSAAAQRHLEQFPSLQNGTNRTENTLLNVVRNGVSEPIEIFGAAQAFEENVFMGDTIFWTYIKPMTQSNPPLLELEDGGAFHLPTLDLSPEEFREQRLVITETGERVLDDELDWLSINEIDKWFGGVRLREGNIWRWDTETKVLVPPEENI